MIVQLLEILNKLDPKDPDVLKLTELEAFKDERYIKSFWAISHDSDDFVFRAFCKHYHHRILISVEKVIEFLDKYFLRERKDFTYEEADKAFKQIGLEDEAKIENN